MSYFSRKGVNRGSIPKNYTDFSNLGNWLPVYCDPSLATLTFGVGGQATIASAGAYAATQRFVCGVRSRFRVYADLSGIINLYCKFSPINFPVGSATCNILTGMFVDLMTPGITQNAYTGVEVATNNATQVLPSYGTFQANSAFSRLASAFVNRPGISIEIKQNWALNAGLGYSNLQPWQYSFDGAAYVNGPNNNSNVNSGSIIYGAHIFLGCVFNEKLLNFSVTLNNFVINNGIGILE